eukprot:204558_1
MSDVLVKGFLDKRGKFNKAWKRRWFVLKSDFKLYYFKSHVIDDKNICGIINLNDTETIEVPLSGADLSNAWVSSIPENITKILKTVKRSWIIHLKLPKRTYILAADKLESYMVWLTELSKYKKNIRNANCILNRTTSPLLNRHISRSNPIYQAFDVWQCDCCNSINQVNDVFCIKCANIRVDVILPVTVSGYYDMFSESCRLSIFYSKLITIKHLLDVIIKIIQENHIPKVYTICHVDKSSFTQFDSRIDNNIWEDLLSRPLTTYTKSQIQLDGINVKVKIEYVHKVQKNDITCPFMKTKDSKKHSDAKIDDEKLNEMQCPIYYAMISEKKFAEENLEHLFEYTHFIDEYGEKLQCKQGQNCEFFKRLENGENRLEDKCHVRLYKHPPRNSRQFKLAE